MGESPWRVHLHVDNEQAMISGVKDIRTVRRGDVIDMEIETDQGVTASVFPIISALRCRASHRRGHRRRACHYGGHR